MLPRLLLAAISVYELLIIIRCIMSWVSTGAAPNAFFEFIHTVTEPVMAPARRIIPPYRGIDFSPIAVIVALTILRRVVIALFAY